MASSAEDAIADGYPTKPTPGDVPRTELVKAAAGEPVCSLSLAMLVLGGFRRMPKSKQATGTDPRALIAPMATGGVVAGVVGRLFVGDTPTVLTVLVLVAGLGVVTVGAARRRRVGAHLGGVVATVAVHLAVAGELARRRGSSSWARSSRHCGWSRSRRSPNGPSEAAGGTPCSPARSAWSGSWPVGSAGGVDPVDP